MSNKKLLFFISIGVILIASIIIFLFIKGGSTSAPTDTTSSLKIWIVGDTTDGYAPIIA